MSRADRFDRADFEVRYPEQLASPVDAPAAPHAQEEFPASKAPVATAPAKARRIIWPVAREHIQRIGESVLTDRNGRGRPHKGVDIFADAGTEILAARGGQVLRVVDGRKGESKAQRAGLFVDIRGADLLIYRYLHLGAASVEPGASVKQGTVIGKVAAAHTSGLAEAPHLHFEIRQGDYVRSRQDYGAPIDPRRLLPPLQA